MLCRKKDPRNGQQEKSYPKTYWIIFEAQKGARKKMEKTQAQIKERDRMRRMLVVLKMRTKLLVDSYVSVPADGSCRLDLEQRGLNSKIGSSSSPPPFVSSDPL